MTLHWLLLMANRASGFVVNSVFRVVGRFGSETSPHPNGKISKAMIFAMGSFG